MLNWSLRFLLSSSSYIMDCGLVFALCGLLVSTVFDIAFHGLLRIRLAGSRGASSPPADTRIDGKSSLDMNEVDTLFNDF